MSLKIVLADDSMTAQNMGKKILVDAGFEVVTVSNGAAAVKKIAELKPDIAILDIYMPGYTGLEVCEKTKNAPETAHVPVLLTVGKLEPYRPEEGAKVRAEGVIIKPFEATDLLTALGRIAQKYNLRVPQIEPIEIKPREVVELPQDQSYRDWKATTVDEETVRIDSKTQPINERTQPMYEKTVKLSAQDLQDLLAKKAKEVAESTMPHIVPPPASASSPDGISTQKIEVPQALREVLHEAPVVAPPAPVHEAEPPKPMFDLDEPAAGPTVPAYNISDLMSSPAPVMESPAYVIDEPVVAEPSEISNTRFQASSIPDELPTHGLEANAMAAAAAAAVPIIPAVAHELETFAPAVAPEVPHVDPELETTAHAKVDAEVAKLSELETNGHEEASQVAHVPDPALVTSNDDLMQFAVKFSEAAPELAENDPMARAVEALEAVDSHESAPVEEAAVAESQMSSDPHGAYGDDPMVQMGAIVVEPQAVTPDLIAEFDKPVTEEDAPEHVEVEPVVEQAAAAIDEPAVLAPPETHAEEENLKKFASELHEAIAMMPSTPHNEPAEVVEEAAHVVEAAPMAEAAAAAVSQPAAHDHELASSLAAALESAAHEKQGLRGRISIDATAVAKAVQRVFDRYKEKMITDIADELGKEE